MRERVPMEPQLGVVNVKPKRQRAPMPQPAPPPTTADDHDDHGADTAQPKQPPAPAAPAPAAPAPQRSKPGQESPAKPRARVGRPRKAVDANDPTGIFNSTLSLPVGLTDRLKDWAHQQRVTYAQAVMAAIEAHYDELENLVAALQPAEVSGRLFTVTEKAEQEPRTSVTFHMENRNLAVLDQLVDQVGADNRSELCIAALDAYLPAAE